MKILVTGGAGFIGTNLVKELLRQQYSVRVADNLINKILNRKVKPIYQQPKPGDTKYSLADITTAKKLLNYQPVVTFKMGLRSAVKWYEDNICAEL